MVAQWAGQFSYIFGGVQERNSGSLPVGGLFISCGCFVLCKLVYVFKIFFLVCFCSCVSLERDSYFANIFTGKIYNLELTGRITNMLDYRT